ncbi:MAG: ribulose-phosphate 3-epimerase [Gemmatimonadales bacterium]|nr:MAG: ribulose-phosphate 3-epimerase [Gemmatimonadales bacterium]
MRRRRPVRIAPSILSADFGHLARDVAAVEEAGADWIHVDVMDGHFVPNLTIGPGVTAAVRSATSLPVDVHLMIEQPQRWIEAFADAGADWITVHHEACPHLHRVVEQIRDAGARPGVAVNPATPVEVLRDILPDIDLVLVMSVNPGFGGQRFIEGAPDRVRRVRELASRVRSTPLPALQVDGGVAAGSAPAVVAAGADCLVAGSAVYGHPGGAAGGMAALREAVESVPEPGEVRA